MKPLYWSRLQIHDLQKRQVDTSQLIWSSLDEVSIEFDALDKEFSQCAPVKKVKPKKAAPKVKKGMI